MKAATLEAVITVFTDWRNQRKNQSTPIPPNLWAMAVSLYPKHTRSTICTSLRLNGGQFKRRLEEGSDATPKGFVLAYKEEHAANPVADAEIKLTLQGKERSLLLCVDVRFLCQILPHLGSLL